MRGIKWTDEQVVILRRDYPTICGKVIAENLGLKHSQILNKAHNLGLKKDIQFLRDAGKRLIDTGKAHRYEKGSVPANKGKKLEDFMNPDTVEKFRSNQFKKGNNPHNALEVGAEVIRTDKRSGKSYVLIKVEGIVKLVYKHIHIWETENNKKLPKGFNIVFKDGNNMNFDIDNLECISNSELMKRNTIQRYPEELKKEMRKLGKLKRVIKNIEKNE